MLRNLFRSCQIPKNIRIMDVTFKEPKVSYPSKIKTVNKRTGMCVLYLQHPHTELGETMGRNRGVWGVSRRAPARELAGESLTPTPLG